MRLTFAEVGPSALGALAVTVVILLLRGHRRRDARALLAGFVLSGVKSSVPAADG